MPARPTHLKQAARARQGSLHHRLHPKARICPQTAWGFLNSVYHKMMRDKQKSFKIVTNQNFAKRDKAKPKTKM
jgi:hypothetical protein